MRQKSQSSQASLLKRPTSDHDRHPQTILIRLRHHAKVQVEHVLFFPLNYQLFALHQGGASVISGHQKVGIRVQTEGCDNPLRYIISRTLYVVCEDRRETLELF